MPDEEVSINKSIYVESVVCWFNDSPNVKNNNEEKKRVARRTCTIRRLYITPSPARSNMDTSENVEVNKIICEIREIKMCENGKRLNNHCKMVQLENGEIKCRFASCPNIKDSFDGLS